MPWSIEAHRLSIVPACAALCLLAGCAVEGPNFSPPDPAVPPQWSGTQGAKDNSYLAAKVGTSIDVQAEPDPQWWHRFNDTLLDSLEERAVAGNLDLKEAVLRIAASRSQEQITRAQGLPNLKAAASYDRDQLGLEGVIKANGGLPPQLKNNPTALTAESQLTQPVNLFTVALDASWELDLFGKVARSVEAAGAQTQAQQEARRGALVSLEAEVAQTYVQVRAAQSLRALTHTILDDQRQSLALTQSLQTHGMARQADVEALEAQLAQNEAQLPQYELQIAQAANALAVLVGTTPGLLNDELAGEGKLFAVPNSVAIGLPAALARRRPDIREAEANLHAAAAQTGVAIASLFPDVSLGAQYGVRNTSTKYLFNWASRFYTAGPSVSLPIFQGGALTASVHLARAEQEAAALEYRKTVLNALSEVENALVALDQDQAKSDALKRADDASDRSLALARDAYHGGLATFITVLDGERQSAQAKVQLAAALAQQSADLITLYKALGGGWEWQPVPTAAGGAGQAQN